MSSRALGELEQLVLLAILRLGEEAYGVPIMEEIEQRTGRAVNRSAVYVALTRMEKRGLLTSRMGEPTPERGGKARRYFSVKPEAVAKIKASKEALASMWEGVESLS